jgi:hypothetical protein
MKTRIALSCFLLFAVAGCDFTVTQVADAAPASDGIGTSPSGPTIAEPSQAAVPLLAPLVAFLFSEQGMALVGTGVLWAINRFVKKKSRKEQIAEYASQAFLVAEAMGLTKKLDGTGKYKAFIQTVVDALRAAGQAELSAKEVAELKALAERKAWIGKLAK